MAAKKTTTTEKAVEKPKKTSTELDLAKVTPEMIKKLKQEYAQAKLDVFTGKQKNTSLLKQQRRDIAKAITHLTFKQSINNE
jgi:ribosomal protein L29